MTLTETQTGVWQASGELTFTTCADSWDALLATLRGSQLRLDVTGLIRVDSAGLATLLAWVGEAQQRKVAVQLVGASEQLLQMARVSGVDTVLPLQWQADGVAVNG